MGQLRADPDIAAAVSPWTDPQYRAKLVSDDKTEGLIVALVRGGDDAAPAKASEIASHYTGERDEVTIRGRGQTIVFMRQTITAHDLMLAGPSLPLCFLLLVWFLRSAIAAAIPIATGMVAIVGTTAILFLRIIRRRALDLRDEPDRRHRSGAGDRLFAADHQSISGGDCGRPLQ